MSERLLLHERQWQLAGLLPAEISLAEEDPQSIQWFDTPFPATVRHAHRHLGRELPKDWDHREWWYRCKFPRPGGKDRVVRLLIGGVDYHEVVYLNGDRLGEDKGAFGKIWYDISESLADENELLVRVSPAAMARDRMLTPNRSPLRWENPGDPAYEDVGIWDEVAVYVTGPVYFDGWLVQSEMTAKGGDLTLRLEYNNTRQHTEATIRLTVEGEGMQPVHEEFVRELASGESRQEISLMVPEAKGWFPHTQGNPMLYTLKGELKLGGGAVDAFTQTVGFRTARVQRSGEINKLWAVSINGKNVPLRGVNWTGMSLYPGHHYVDLVTQLRDAGVNAIRVWGGRHRRPFYEACDRLGILVVQEFPYGLMDGMTYPRQSRDFPEAKEILHTARSDNAGFARALRNHPSLLMWIGGTRLHNQDNAHVMRTVEDALRTQDGTRPYIPVIPAEGMRLDTDVRIAGLSPEHLEDAPRLLIAQGLPAWAANKEPLEAFPPRWRKFGGESAQARAVAWAAGAQRTEPTAGGFIGEMFDWHPDGGYGLFDFDGQPRPAWSVLAGLYGRRTAGLRFDWKTYASGTFEAEAWGAADDDAGDIKADLWVENGVGETGEKMKLQGHAKGGLAALGDINLPLVGKPPFTAWIQAEGGQAVPYPLDAGKPPSSASLAEIHGIRQRLATQTLTYRPVRDIGIIGLMPIEALLRGILALRLMIGV
jgi:hypothetical protein